jgi:hypothetical protein
VPRVRRRDSYAATAAACVMHPLRYSHHKESVACMDVAAINTSKGADKSAPKAPFVLRFLTAVAPLQAAASFSFSQVAFV